MQTEQSEVQIDTALTVGSASEGSPMGSFAEQAAQTAGFESLAPPLQIALFLGAMVMLSGAMVTITAFTRIVIVLSFVRRALSTQEIPPTQVIIGLSLFMTVFVMAPTFKHIHKEAITPYFAGDANATQVFTISKDAMLDFMKKELNNESGQESISMFMEISKTEPTTDINDAPHVIVPAFIIHELRLAFIMGFCIYIPFLLIDLVVSTVLMSLGMMMMPPVIISTPCKLMLFVLVDGWALIVGTLARSFQLS